MRSRNLRTLTGCLAVLLSASLPVARGEAQSSGKVVAVNHDATGTPPAAATRTLVVGTGVIFKERIKTSLQGSTQLLFPDQSTLNIGRNSNLVIDEYVYSPKTGTGTMLASLRRGALRFVGGQISHTKGVTITTPVASLGIRGGVASIAFPISPSFAALDPQLAGCSGELVIGHAGVVLLTNKVSQVLVQPGFAACVNGANVPIGQPFRVSDTVLAAIVDRLTSGPGQIGGIVTVPAEPLLTREGFGGTILPDPYDAPGSDPFGYASILGVGDVVVRSKSQALQTQNVVGPARTPTVTQPTAPVQQPPNTSPPISPP